MDLIIKHISGGKISSEKTGTYQNFIIFSSIKHNGSWSCEYEKVTYKGSLKIQGVTIFNYVYHNTFFEIQEVLESGRLSNWKEIKIIRIWSY
jgi:hypothetical protein